MPPFPKQGDQIRKCEGTCGRMTRNTKMSKDDYPDTVTRVNGTHCQACYRALAEPDPSFEKMMARREERKQALAVERLAAAERVRAQVAADRAARAAKRRARPVSMGQSMVRI